MVSPIAHSDLYYTKFAWLIYSQGIATFKSRLGITVTLTINFFIPMHGCTCTLWSIQLLANEANDSQSLYPWGQ